MNGNPASGYTPPPPPPPRAKKTVEQKKAVNQENEAADEPILPPVEEITAKDCYESAMKNGDKNIGHYINAINGKIKKEIAAGGFSTNITFRVTPNDWVNITHIIDWYRARGFQVMNYETSNPQVGPNAGTIQHNFTISWAVVG